MELHELNRMFDRIAPTPEQEQDGLDRLLQTERKGTPIKRLKKLTVLGIAAALMIAACAAALVTGIDQRLADYFGASPEQVELLAPGAVPLDVTVEDNGATFHVSQVLMDRYSILLLADFTAPEGTVLDMDEGNDVAQGFGAMEWHLPDLLDQEGTAISRPGGWGWQTTVLDDGAPLDNHLTLLFRMKLMNGIQPGWNISGISLHNVDLLRYDPELMQYITVYPGDWSCQVPFTWKDMGRSIQLDKMAGTLDGANITARHVYLSPMTLQITLEREVPIGDEDDEIYGRWLSAANVNHVMLTTRDGQIIPLTARGGAVGDQDQERAFQLDEITSLEQLQGGTLTLRIGDGIVDIPLDDLVSAE